MEIQPTPRTWLYISILLYQQGADFLMSLSNLDNSFCRWNKQKSQIQDKQGINRISQWRNQGAGIGRGLPDHFKYLLRLKVKKKPIIISQLKDTYTWPSYVKILVPLLDLIQEKRTKPNPLSSQCVLSSIYMYNSITT